MEFLSIISDFLFKPFLVFIKQQWKGFGLGVLLLALLFFIFIYPVVQKHFEMGTYVGNFMIKKGTNLLVATNELNVKFSTRIYHTTRSNNNDSVKVYPEIVLSNFRRNHSNTYLSNIVVGQRINHDAKYFIYTIEFLDFEFISKDTFVTIDVYRREYPNNLRP